MESFLADVTKILIGYFTREHSWDALSWPFSDWPPWEKTRQFNKRNCVYCFYLMIYLVPSNNPCWYRTQALGALLHAGPCSLQLGHLKVTLLVPRSPVVFRGVSGRRNYENQPLHHCAGFIYSLLGYFLLLWLLQSLLGLSEAASVSCSFDFDFPWLDWGFAETENKWKQNAPTHRNIGGCWEAGVRKLMSKMKVSNLGIPRCSGHQLMSWQYLFNSAKHKPWLLPNYQAQWNFLFFFLDTKEFYNPPLFITRSFVQWAFPESQQVLKPWLCIDALPSPRGASLWGSLYLSGSQFHHSQG